MMKSRVKAAAAAGLCVSLGVVLAPSLAVAADKWQDVVVRNADTEPVPVKEIGTPTVTVSGTPSVNLAGTPEVLLAGSPQVTLAGTPAVTTAEEPIQFRAQFEFSGTALAFSVDDFTVPEGKRLRIDAVTFHDGNREAAVEGVQLRIWTQRADNVQTLTNHHIPVSTQASNGDVAGAAMSFHVKAGDRVDMSVGLDRVLGVSGSSTHYMYGTWSGVLLPA